MIVNNSAQQPDGAGHRYIRNGKDDSTVYVSADSTAYDFCLQLGKHIAASPVFYDVRLCGDTLRRDSVFYERKSFSANEVQTLCDDYGVDALISLENFVFFTEIREDRTSNYSFESSIRVNLSGELRAVWPGQKETYVFPFSDSLKLFYPVDFYSDPLVETIPVSELKYAMHHLSEVIAEKMYINFVPHWSYDNRWYYTSISSEWKRGTVLVASGKWDEAADIWEALLSKVKKWNPKARLLSNMALCNEITGDFEKAIDYAGKSYQLFKEYAGENDAYTKLQKRYLEILNERAENDKTLSEQLREKISN
ncbi:MAG: tetratricopeptide repeat protein [Tannerella sp.]|jgi:tetratricopeptide (TPR) repeat protein|nr:tetratricopeptide repeat protein [Tannerella sp.]